MPRNILINCRAFSLLELTVVIIILTILASAAIPVLSRAYIEKAGNKTALDMSAIQEAARAFYVDQNKWPDSISTLQSGNYLPSSWNKMNPFGSAYNSSSTGSTFIVNTIVPNTALAIIQNLLPTNWVSGTNIYSSVPVPGALSVLPTGSIMPWASQNIPVGFLLCDGQIYNISDYPALADILGKGFGGDGINTFAVPNLQGKAVFGYQAGDSHFGALGKSGGSASMVGDGIVSGNVDTYNFFNRVKIANGSLWDMSGAQSAQGVSTTILNPYLTLNYVIKT